MRYRVGVAVVGVAVLAGCVDLGQLLVGATMQAIGRANGVIRPASRPSPTASATPTPPAVPATPVGSAARASAPPMPVATPRPSAPPDPVYPVEAVVTTDGTTLDIPQTTTMAAMVKPNGSYHAAFVVGDVMAFRQVALTLDADVPFTSPELSAAHVTQAQLTIVQPSENGQFPISAVAALFGKELTADSLVVVSAGDRLTARITIDFKGRQGFGLVEARFTGLRFKP